MHELLGEQDIISNAMATEKTTLLRTNQARDNQLHMPNQNPNIYFIKGFGQIMQPIP